MATIELEKNLNGKIGCGFMVHIMKPAKEGITDAAKEKVITFKIGESFAVNYTMFDYAKTKVKDIPAHIYMSSQGSISKKEFMEQMQDKYGLRPEADAGIYFFILAV